MSPAVAALCCCLFNCCYPGSARAAAAQQHRDDRSDNSNLKNGAHTTCTCGASCQRSWRSQKKDAEGIVTLFPMRKQAPRSNDDVVTSSVVTVTAGLLVGTGYESLESLQSTIVLHNCALYGDYCTLHNDAILLLPKVSC